MTGNLPLAIAITPDGKTAYVANVGSQSVTPIATATDTAGADISVGISPEAIAITPPPPPETKARLHQRLVRNRPHQPAVHLPHHHDRHAGAHDHKNGPVCRGA